DSGQGAIGVVANTILLTPPAFPDQNGPFGGTITISGGSITTKGSNAIGVLSAGSESKVTLLNGAEVVTQAAIAIEATPPPGSVFTNVPVGTGGVVILDDASAKAGSSGAPVSGALVQDGGQLTIQNKSSLEGSSDGVTLTNSAGNTLVN